MTVNSTPGAAKAISYEVILSPRVENARQPQLTPKREGILTRQDIDEKIAAAESRRKVRNKIQLINDSQSGTELKYYKTHFIWNGLDRSISSKLFFLEVQ